MRLFLLVISFAAIVGTNVSAQDTQVENGPVIIPERLQQLATEFPVARRLGVDWQKASAGDITKYVGFLASTAVLANEVASRNKRKAPSDDDFLAALSMQCIWPPNKPPFVEQYWPAQIVAFYDEKVRDALRKAIGPAGFGMPSVIEKYGKDQFAAEGGFLPQKEDDYFKQVFDPRQLPGAR
ncbi:hypothetical protein OOJ09_19155 [Mesorhizobium qingshengii]|uniref:Gluconate 2-dehydrogenase subunit 3 n=1 Tax=Mesorhizobium qingshengii TaxID=1165689 RepID=A0ABT4QXJ5_9HYPH|nr:hypothetical protein [Mesorhizobium qingshengii]MCZ8546312.1 hypothetical protein [Mesorhizobium qingshengii]